MPQSDANRHLPQRHMPWPPWGWTPFAVAAAALLLGCAEGATVRDTDTTHGPANDATAPDANPDDDGSSVITVGGDLEGVTCDAAAKAKGAAGCRFQSVQLSALYDAGGQCFVM